MKKTFIELFRLVIIILRTTLKEFLDFVIGINNK